MEADRGASSWPSGAAGHGSDQSAGHNTANRPMRGAREEAVELDAALTANERADLIDVLDSECGCVLNRVCPSVEQCFMTLSFIAASTKLGLLLMVVWLVKLIAPESGLARRAAVSAQLQQQKSQTCRSQLAGSGSHSDGDNGSASRRVIGRVVSGVFLVLDNVASLAGWLLLLLVWSAYAGIFYAWATDVVPYVAEKHGTAFGTIHAIFMLWMFVMVGFNYLQVTTVSPGRPPKTYTQQEVEAFRKIPNLRYCRKCDNVKPPRTHHCSLCQSCVLVMDHHCPWVNNCVGHFNYRYFVMFLAYTLAGCLVICFFSFKLFWLRFALRHHFPLNEADVQLAENFGLQGVLSLRITLLFTVSLAVSIALTILLGWHLYLISTGRTTLEYYQKAAAGGMHQLGWRKNWRVFVGNCRSVWQGLLLPSTHPPYGDGIWSTVPAGYDTRRRPENV